MSFPKDGRNHHSAVKSEKNLHFYKKELEKIYKKSILRFEHKGGTKYKEDVVVHFVDGTFEKISLKQKKKGLKVGSFDYINTTLFEKELFNNSFNVFNKYKNSKNRKNSQLLKESCSHDLNNLPDIDVTNFFIENVVNKYKHLDLVILDESEKKIYKVYPKVFDYVKNGGLLTIENSNKITQSKKILAKTENGNLDIFNLRIRFHLNNGNSKWLGLSKGSSSLVIKIQQDKVSNLI